MFPQVMEPVITAEEYIRRDNNNDYQLEFINNRIVPMPGGSYIHGRIVSRINTALDRELNDRGCESVPGHLRVEVDSGASYTYPDVILVCGAPRFRPGMRPDTLTNPTLLFEVLSPSTEERDRGDKFDMYLQIPSLQGYFMVAQDEPRIDCVQRDGSSWIESAHEGMDDRLVINAPACELPMREIYLHLRVDD